MPGAIDFHLQLFSLLDDVIGYLFLKALNDTKHLMSHWEKQSSSLACARRKTINFLAPVFPSLKAITLLSYSEYKNSSPTIPKSCNQAGSTSLLAVWVSVLTSVPHCSRNCNLNAPWTGI